MEYFDNLEKYIQRIDDEWAKFESDREEYAMTHGTVDVAEWSIKNAPKESVSIGDRLAVDCYIKSDKSRKGDGDYIINEPIYVAQVKPLMDSLKKSGLKSFIYGYCDYNSFNILSLMCDNGCIVDSMESFTWIQNGQSKEYPGVKVLIQDIK